MGSTKITVYLVDDHAMVREGLASVLSRHSAVRVVGQCGDGTTALKEIQRLQPDVAIIDIGLPGLNGLDICRELTRSAGNVAILILTMHSDEQFVARAIREGAAGYVLKESAAEELAEAIERVAEGELYLGPGVPTGALGAAADGTEPYDLLSTRERQVLHLVAEGKTNRDIAEKLNLSVKTVDTHRSRLMRKLKIHDQTSLVKYAVRRGIVPLQ